MNKFIYIRSLDGAREPVGCVAYSDLGDNTFAYGVSFLNPVNPNSSETPLPKLTGG